MHTIRFSVLIIFSLSILGSNAQNALSLKEKIGDKYYRNMSYMQAIATYEDIYKEDSTNKRILPNLAYSYRKISDAYNAERIFEKVVNNDTNNATYVLEYAQILAINKKYKQSAEQYERYARLNPNNKRGKAFAEAYQSSNSIINKDTKSVISLANFNSSQSDFSPAFYKKGLVFVSNRNYHTAIKRTFEWDQTSFLDLYYIPDTSSIQSVKQDTSKGKTERKKIIYNDDDTRATSNDSRTMGYIGYKYADTTGMFATAAVVATPFSKKIKTKYHEGPATFTADQKTIIFTRNNYNKGKARRSKQGINLLQLYSARIDNDKWTQVKPLNINNNNYSVGHPTLAPGDTILYFASDMPGGYGGTDIYKSYWRNNEWSTPENLGDKINTDGNELFPYIDKDGVFYFSSTGHPGLGGLDIFRTSLTKIEIENLGLPINSNYDDFGIALNGTAVHGYISSNRRRGVNDDDIYKIELIKTAPYTIKVIDSLTGELIAKSQVIVNDSITGEYPTVDSSSTGKFNAKLWNNTVYTLNASAYGYFPKVMFQRSDVYSPEMIVPLVRKEKGCIVAGTITDKDTKLPVEGARLVIIDNQTKDTVYDIRTGKDGKYRYAMLKVNRTYNIDVSKDGYFNKPYTQLQTSDKECAYDLEHPFDYLRDFELEQIVVGKAIKIENIYFDLDKYFIRKDAAKELDKIVKLMQENPDIIIELSSHTDCRATFKYNMTLSDNRAKASAAYIVSKGISKNRITGKGYGETKLVNDCACEGKVVSRVCTDDEHQANRRTEFQVTGFLVDKNTTILNEGRGQTPKSVPEPVK